MKTRIIITGILAIGLMTMTSCSSGKCSSMGCGYWGNESSKTGQVEYKEELNSELNKFTYVKVN